MGYTGVAARIGEEAPGFSLPGLDGGRVNLSDYIGKRLIVFMWASW